MRDVDQLQPAFVLDAVTRRRSVRRFLPKPVPTEIVSAILEGATRAPSGTNIQPWQVHVVTDAARDRLSRAVIRAAEAGHRSEEHPPPPAPLKEPYLSRRRRVGFELYKLYGIERDDMQGRQRAMLRNYEFFGAPVGLFFTVERCLPWGSWLYGGMFMQNVMILARAYGLDTCAQQAWGEFGATVHEELSIPSDHIILSGMALGFADPNAPENTLQSERVPFQEFTTFHRV